jgi:hypothetical protein
MRFHALGIPHTASNKDWLCCAFTQKIVKLCQMLKARGHTVIHYGNAASAVACDEHVSVTETGDLGPPSGYLDFKLDSPLYQKFFAGAIAAIQARKRPRDFLLCMWGAGHKPVADAHGDLIVVEPGIGYTGGHFAPYKVFESYATLHAYYGLTTQQLGWYDVVIPNYFEPADFTFKAHKQDYLLFLGRVHPCKGIIIAEQVAQASGRRLIVAGHDCGHPLNRTTEYVGMVGVEQRRELLANAAALIAPSTYLEPFCGTVTEAHFSGTPTITSDWGAFAENNLHGITGYRCRTFEHFVWAARNTENIHPEACRAFAASNFSMERVVGMYDEFFWSVMQIYGGDGWYAPNPERQNLDWLTRHYA